VLGHGGMAWGLGLHGDGPTAKLEGPRKREGDGRSPAGVFELGLAFGRSDALATALPYASETSTLRCVDDPGSAHYNQIVDAAQVDEDWRSAEPMRRYYELAITVEHNASDVPEAGSCIFLHAWRDAESPVTGCTAMAADELEQLAAWLEPGAVLVALPRELQSELASAWRLPPLP
jgi:L,D-peptidoglycan transpeptidase YkuD (ErfK/YbiS/YcfS/YnhG family)